MFLWSEDDVWQLLRVPSGGSLFWLCVGQRPFSLSLDWGDSIFLKWKCMYSCDRIDLHSQLPLQTTPEAWNTNTIPVIIIVSLLYLPSVFCCM